MPTFIGVRTLRILAAATLLAAALNSGPPRAVTAADCSWTGVWTTSYGTMTLTQSGATVTGDYTHDAGRINGTVAGAVLTGRWSEAPSYTEPTDAGRIAFTIADDCTRFTGLWSYGTAEPTAGWNGTRTSTTVPGTVTEPVGPGGGTVAVAGGSAQDGGVSISVPPGAFPATTKLTASVTGSAPTGVSLGGATLLPKTIEVTTESGTALAGGVEIQVNLTVAEIGGRSLSGIQGGVVVGSRLEPRPTRVIDPAGGVLGITADHFTKFTLFAVNAPGPTLTSPAAGSTLPGFGTTLAWTPAAGATQFHLQVSPFNNDGPGVDVIRNVEGSFVLPPPPLWFGLLPDATYFWRVRTTAATTQPVETDWTAWSASTFRTPAAGGAGLTPVAPAAGATGVGTTPTLTWAAGNPQLFYFEVQVSRDPTFNLDPGTATAMVYSSLIHGGVATPPNSYRIPAGFPLQAGVTYHWRVRPRVQGDGKPAAWSPVWSFRS